MQDHVAKQLWSRLVEKEDRLQSEAEHERLALGLRHCPSTSVWPALVRVRTVLTVFEDRFPWIVDAYYAGSEAEYFEAAHRAHLEWLQESAE